MSTRKMVIFVLVSLLISGCGQKPLPGLTSAPGLVTDMPSTPSLKVTPTPTSIPFETPVPAPHSDESFGIVGQIGGPTQSIAVAGSIAYVGIGARLTMLDISTTNAPREIGATQPLDSVVEDIAVTGKLVFIAAGGAGLYIIDVSEPSDPAVIGNYDSAGYAEAVNVTGRYAYLADGPDGLRIIDITDPAHPVEVSSVYSLSYAFDVAIESSHAYIAAAGTGLLVAKVSDPDHPAEEGSLDTPGYAFAIAALGNTLYIADGWEGLRMIDVSDPAQPKEIGLYQTEGWAFDVTLAGTTAYVADAFSGVDILDVSTPTSPVEHGKVDMPGDIVRSLTYNAGNVYIASQNAGVTIVDVSHPDQYRAVASYNALGYADSVAVSGEYAYVAAGPYGVRIVDVSDLSHPREIGAYNTGGYATGVVVADNNAYVITYSTSETPSGMHILDVSDPANPTEVSFISTQGTAQDVVIEKGIVYVANEYGLVLIDVTSPSSPVQLGELTFTQGVDATWGVAVAQQKAYVTHNDSGLKVVNISDPQAPNLIGAYRPDSIKKVLAVAVGGDFAYVTDVVRLHVVDISNPNQPTEAGFYDLPVTAERVVVAGNRLYAADSAGGLVILDISDPHHPTLAGWRRLPGYAFGLAASDNYVFVADGESGLFIIEDTGGEQTSLSAPSDADESRKGTEYSLTRPVRATGRRFSEPALPDYIISPQPDQYPTRDLINTPFISLASQPKDKTLTVTSVEDSGPGTLRWALENAASGATILFDPRVFNPQNPATIYLTSGLPDLQSGNVTIDASNAGVILNGNKASSCTAGLKIRSDRNSIKGLQIVAFSCDGIVIESGKDNVIGGNPTQGIGPLGEGNLISGNSFAGIDIKGAGISNNRIIGNYIGTDLTGARSFGQQTFGIYVASGEENIIGGMTAADRNVIAGNEIADVNLTRQANRNQVLGNYIGINARGQARLGDMGVLIDVGSYNNAIQGNVIGSSVLIGDWGSWGNEVIGNLIGVDATGTISLGGSGLGINASFNRIGGTRIEDRNIISGAGSRGIKIGIWGTSDVFVLGNYVGTDITGTKPIGNYSTGITIYESGAHHIFIGGFGADERNLISGSQDAGISVEGIGSDYNFILGNFIGTDASGDHPLPNHGGGITIQGGDYNFIQNNLVKYNENKGIAIISGTITTCITTN